MSGVDGIEIFETNCMVSRYLIWKQFNTNYQSVIYKSKHHKYILVGTIKGTRMYLSVRKIKIRKIMSICAHILYHLTSNT